MAGPLSLVTMTFPQRWDGNGTVNLNVILLPSVDPVGGPLIGADPATPSFAAGTPTFSVTVQPGVAALPSPTAPGVFAVLPTVVSDPADPLATFELLRSSVTATGKTFGAPVTVPPVTDRIRKALPPSYIAAGGGSPDGVLTTTDDDFSCAVRGTPAVPLTPPPSTISWGEVISYAMRQPLLATRLGILYSLQFSLPDLQADALAGGGWLFVTLADSDPWAVAGAAVPGSIRVHAARIPPLDTAARQLFAANQFVVGATATPPDDAFAVAEEYSDGFAKLVHAAQPTTTDAATGHGELAPASDLGIQVGWDDEQVVRWQNGQLDLLKARRTNPTVVPPAAPLGILGYRVDVADVTPATPGGAPQAPAWQSLVRVNATVGSLGTFTGELTVEPSSTRPNDPSLTESWLPRYFANWRGGSLCEPDAIPEAMGKGQQPPVPARTADGLTALLSYGHLYSFRVRLADLSSGGPLGDDGPIDPPPNAVALQRFQRLVPPKAPTVVQTPSPAPGGQQGSPTSLTIGRPLIGYPEVLFTGLGDTAAARDTMRSTLVDAAVTQVAAVKADPAGPRTDVAGLPDPDVDAVDLEVLVRHPLHDGDGSTFQTLYRTTRALDAVIGAAPLGSDPGTTIDVVYVDATTIEDWAPEQPATGPLLIPRGRDVQIKVRAALRHDETGYFAAQASPRMAATIGVRAEPMAEPALLRPADSENPITGYLFRRPSNVAAPGVVQQLAELIGVASNGNAVTSPPGQRVVFGASKGLRHTISGDGETLTFGSTSDLLGTWVVAIVVDVERDWTWDGLQASGFVVLRGGPADTEADDPPAVGAITIPRVVGVASQMHPTAVARSRTRLVFFDAVDPHEPVPGSGFPESLQHRWFVTPARTAAGPPADPGAPAPTLGISPLPPITGEDLADTPLDLRLPIAIPPAQVPKIASVGLAQSPYVAGHAYASTEKRQRSLWIELTEPIDNAVGDALFARVLAHGADPLLYDATPAFAKPINDPPLPLDPELVRAVVPDDTDDRAGINAMTQLIRSSKSPVHFLLPLPPGVEPEDPELFGFYSYELRIGHAGPVGDLRWWSTANARFGAPLRVVGVQHPAPPLTCRAGRFAVPAVTTSTLLTQLRASSTAPFPIEAVIPRLAETVGRSSVSAPTAAAAGPPPGSSVRAIVDPPHISVLPPLPSGQVGATFDPGLLDGLKVVEAPRSIVVVSAPYATPVLDGRVLAGPFDTPKTQMWFFVYGQVVQADAFSMRNVLLATSKGVYIRPIRDEAEFQLPALVRQFANNAHSKDRTALAFFTQAELATLLTTLHLPISTPLSVLAVELLPGGTGDDVGTPPPGGVPVHDAAADGNVHAASRIEPQQAFPFGRILRASPLTPVGPIC